MRIALFVHSLLSDWNHGNAHFLRGVGTELQAWGHEVLFFEPRDSWSLRNLLADHGEKALDGFRAAYPTLTSTRYDRLDLLRRIGEHRRRNDYRLLFHDTHHRAVTAPEQMAAYDLSGYDGVLAFGGVIRDLYLERGWAGRAWTWHEAADVRVFHPIAGEPREGDLIWIGNWGDDERTAELQEFLIGPARGLRTRVHGVRYPEEARTYLADAGIEYAGWLPNHEVPRAFARFRVTVHVPRRPYVQALPGIPTIRPFEALACGIPLISAPWDDAEGLFTPGEDYWVARNGEEMKRHLRDLLADPGMAAEIARSGRETILDRHTCAHRVDELLAIDREIDRELRGTSARTGASLGAAMP